jgi:hypothetical protein
MSAPRLALAALAALLLACTAHAQQGTFVTSLAGLGSVPIGATPLSWPGVSVMTLHYLNSTDPDVRAAAAALRCCGAARRGAAARRGGARARGGADAGAAARAPGGVQRWQQRGILLSAGHRRVAGPVAGVPGGVRAPPAGRPASRLQDQPRTSPPAYRSTQTHLLTPLRRRRLRRSSMFCWNGESCHDRYSSKPFWMSSNPVREATTCKRMRTGAGRALLAPCSRRASTAAPPPCAAPRTRTARAWHGCAALTRSHACACVPPRLFVRAVGVGDGAVRHLRHRAHRLRLGQRQQGLYQGAAGNEPPMRASAQALTRRCRCPRAVLLQRPVERRPGGLARHLGLCLCVRARAGRPGAARGAC